MYFILTYIIIPPDGLGNKGPVAMSNAEKTELQIYEDYIPFIFENLPCADPERRGLSIKCLGMFIYLFSYVACIWI